MAKPAFFIGLNLPLTAKSELGAAVARLRALPAMKSVKHLFDWAPDHRLHITLHYYGALPPAELATLLASMCGIQVPEPLPWRVDTFGVFKTKTNLPNILWAEPSPLFDLRAFYTTLARTCQLPPSATFDKFAAHITIARLKQKIVKPTHHEALVQLAANFATHPAAHTGGASDAGAGAEAALGGGGGGDGGGGGGAGRGAAPQALKLPPVAVSFVVDRVSLMYNDGHTYVEHATFPAAP